MASSLWKFLCIVFLQVSCYDCKVFIKDGKNYFSRIYVIYFKVIILLYLSTTLNMFSTGKVVKFDENEDFLIVHERQLVRFSPLTCVNSFKNKLENEYEYLISFNMFNYKRQLEAHSEREVLYLNLFRVALMDNVNVVYITVLWKPNVFVVPASTVLRHRKVIRVNAQIVV